MATDDLKDRVQTLTLALGDEQVSVRWNACKDLARLGPEAAEALPALSRCLVSLDATTALWARYAIVKIKGDLQKHMPLFIRALSDKRVFPGMAATAVAGFGPDARDAVPQLSLLLQDDLADNRWCAAIALAQIGRDSASAVPALIEALGDTDENVRHCAAFALGEIGPAAGTAVPALIARLDDFDDDVRGYAARALGRIGRATAGVVPSLQPLLADDNPAVREEARIAIDKLMGTDG